MSYRSAGIFSIVVGIALLPALLVGVVFILRGMHLLRLHDKSVEPGTNPDACAGFGYGHDWRASLPGYPAGVTCRNCLLRKDRKVIAWSGLMPPGIPTVPYPPHPVWVPRNVERRRKKLGDSPTFLFVNPTLAVPDDIKLEVVGFGSP